MAMSFSTAGKLHSWSAAYILHVLSISLIIFLTRRLVQACEHVGEVQFWLLKVIYLVLIHIGCWLWLLEGSSDIQIPISWSFVFCHRPTYG